MSVAWGRVGVRGYATCAAPGCGRRFALPATRGRPPRYCPWHPRRSNGRVKTIYRPASLNT